MNRSNEVLNHLPHRPLNTGLGNQNSPLGSTVSLHVPRRPMAASTIHVHQVKMESTKFQQAEISSSNGGHIRDENVDTRGSASSNGVTFSRSATRQCDAETMAHLRDLINRYTGYDREHGKKVFEQWKQKKSQTSKQQSVGVEQTPARSKLNQQSLPRHQKSTSNTLKTNHNHHHESSKQQDRGAHAYQEWLKMKANEKQRQEQNQAAKEQRERERIAIEKEQEKRKHAQNKKAISEWKQKKAELEEQARLFAEEQERLAQERDQEKWLRGLQAMNHWLQTHPLNQEAIRLHIYPHRKPWQDIVTSDQILSKRKGKGKVILSPPHLYEDFETCMKLAGPNFIRKYPLLVASARADPPIPESSVASKPRQKSSLPKSRKSPAKNTRKTQNK